LKKQEGELKYLIGTNSFAHATVQGKMSLIKDVELVESINKIETQLKDSNIGPMLKRRERNE